MSEALATKYRPTQLSDVCSQQAIIQILNRQLELHEFKNCYLFSGPSGCGKAQPLWSDVYTPSGYKKIGDLNIGDKVFDGTGHVTTITGVYDRGFLNTYEIIFSDNTRTYCAADHLWKLINIKDDNFEVVSTLDMISLAENNLLENYYIEYPAIQYPESSSISVIDAYNYGCKLSQDNLKLSIPNFEHIDIDHKYMFSSVEARINIILGLYESCGKINLANNLQIEIYSKKLYMKLEHLLRSVGMIVYRDPMCHKLMFNVPSYLASIFFKNNIDRWNPWHKQIKFIFSSKTEECRCIQVASDEHTYLTDSLIVTHNTTVARIFSNLINNSIDGTIEIDAASNNSVENIKNIVKSAYERSISTKYKIYIIDEAHALTNQAWQAFLKCIEEPPKYTIFIFCTTDPQKIPITILNRVQRFNFTQIEYNQIVNRLRYICEQEHFEDYDESIHYIARIAEGGMRTAISMLDKCGGYSSNLNITNVLQCLGMYSYDIFFDLINNLIDQKVTDIITIIEDYYQKGNDLKLFVDQFFSFVIDIAKYNLFHSIQVTKLPSIYQHQLDNVINFEGTNTYYNYILDKLLTLKQNIKGDTIVKDTVLVSFIQIARCQ